MTISDEKRYEFITSQIRYADEKIIGSFGLYVKVTSAIVGGVVWLSTIQRTPPLCTEKYHLIALVLLALVSLGCIWMIIFHARARWGYRSKEHDLVPSVKAPGFPRTVANEIGMIVIIILASTALVILNPL